MPAMTAEPVASTWPLEARPTAFSTSTTGLWSERIVCQAIVRIR
jgi:hypothetical protein